MWLSEGGQSWKINRKADWKVSCPLHSPRWVDLQGGHDKISLLVYQLGHQPVPGAVDYSAPLTVLYSLQSKVKTEIVWEFLDQVNTEAWAASEFGWVWIPHLLCDVYTNLGEQHQNMHKNSSNNKSFQRLHKYPVFDRLNIGFFSVCAVLRPGLVQSPLPSDRGCPWWRCRQSAGPA